MAASRGKNLDRNLIVTILYNIACNYQGLWQLEKCGTYIEAAVFNTMKGVREDEQAYNSLKETLQQGNSSLMLEVQEEFSVKEGKLLKKYGFLIKTLLQYCAVLSQLSQ